MLVLSRLPLEKIIIADVISVEIKQVRGDKVRLGIDAPPHISVHRGEVYAAIQRGKSQRPEVASARLNREQRLVDALLHALESRGLVKGTRIEQAQQVIAEVVRNSDTVSEPEKESPCDSTV